VEGKGCEEEVGGGLRHCVSRGVGTEIKGRVIYVWGVVGGWMDEATIGRRGPRDYFEKKKANVGGMKNNPFPSLENRVLISKDDTRHLGKDTMRRGGKTGTILDQRGAPLYRKSEKRGQEKTGVVPSEKKTGCSRA